MSTDYTSIPFTINEKSLGLPYYIDIRKPIILKMDWKIEMKEPIKKENEVNNICKKKRK